MNSSRMTRFMVRAARDVADSLDPAGDTAIHAIAALANDSGAGVLALEVLEHMTRGLALIDPEHSVIFSNALFRDYHQALGTSADAAIAAAAEEQQTRSKAHEYHLADGRTLCVETARVGANVLLLVEDISSKVAEREQATAEARLDSLTGLGNRLMFRERLGELLAETRSEGDRSAVLSLDLDRFKVINDSLGHPVGDALLRVVADRLRSVLRKGDLAARLGGDEFAILQTGQPQPQAAAELAKRVVDLIGRSYIVDGQLLNIGASVGIVVIPTDGAEIGPLLKNADLALYRAKAGGRGTYRFFEPAMDEQMQARRSLELDLRRVLALRELELAYQPQFNLDTNTVTGFEALLRWNHPKRGAVSPAEFIPVAEEIGMIIPIGEWVIRNATRQAAAWPNGLRVAVNVSALQFASPGLLPTIVSALAESGLPPNRLELEITESVLLADRDAALVVLHHVHDLGVRVSMDDFGTGYSSLSYLHSFPFDKIKIDQSFVRGRGAEEKGIAIIRAIAALGRSLGMSTTAEGVETSEQLARISAEGCTDIQGYLISRPLRPEAIDEFLTAQGIRAERENHGGE